jgi:heme-degrading monooxygenase HmoA
VIRVVYRWRIAREHQGAFGTWWHEGTLRIRASQPGSMGSTLCRDSEDTDVLVGIARWADREHLEAFWAQAGGVRFPGAALESTQILEEVDHLTDERH